MSRLLPYHNCMSHCHLTWMTAGTLKDDYININNSLGTWGKREKKPGRFRRDNTNNSNNSRRYHRRNTHVLVHYLCTTCTFLDIHPDSTGATASSSRRRGTTPFRTGATITTTIPITVAAILPPIMAAAATTTTMLPETEVVTTRWAATTTSRLHPLAGVAGPQTRPDR